MSMMGYRYVLNALGYEAFKAVCFGDDPSFNTGTHPEMPIT